jgi:protein ImuB
MTIWFSHLVTDWLAIRRPELRRLPYVLAAPEHGRMVIKAASTAAEAQGISVGMVVADARAIVTDLQVFDDKPGLTEQLLKALCKWCIRFTPVAAMDLPDGLILDVSGCAHLWGGERPYLKEIVTRLRAAGYHARAAMADTIGAAWAIARFGEVTPIIGSGEQSAALMSLPPAALRLEPAVQERLQKLGLSRIGSFATMPRAVLRRRFGQDLLLRLDQALGFEDEVIQPLVPAQPYEERLPCLEPIVTRTGIEIALERLLEALCKRLRQKGKGLRSAVLKAYRVDGKVEKAEIGTHRASHSVQHLFRLFENKIPAITPALGIELFILEAPVVEELSSLQEKCWRGGCSLDSMRLTELVDRLAGRTGTHTVRRYVPVEHYWPERSFKAAASLAERPATSWRNDRPRPIQLLHEPQPITVSAPIPDYPPMLFHYKGKLHEIKRADGPERIEREWWLEEGPHRDYYAVEDGEGRRYWIFRSGHYDSGQPQRWFLHGFFA